MIQLTDHLPSRVTKRANAHFNNCTQMGLLQFKDLNPHKSPFQRTYANQVKRCEEMARRLRFFTDQIEKSGLTLNEFPSIDRTFDLDELEVKLETLERELLEVNANSDKLRRSHSELVELQLVLEKAGAFFEDARSTANTDNVRPLQYTRSACALLLSFCAPK